VDLTEAVASRDRTAALIALSDHLTGLLIAATPRDAAALARQLRDVLSDLDAQPREEASPVDDLASRRTARRASASAAGS
jgi:hypothetical protein